MKDGTAGGHFLLPLVPFSPHFVMGDEREVFVGMLAVAQLVRASRCEREGRGFDSPQPPKFKKFKRYIDIAI